MSDQEDQQHVRENRRKIMQSACPLCGAQPGQPCRHPSGESVSRSYPPHFKRRMAAIRDGHYQP